MNWLKLFSSTFQAKRLVLLGSSHFHCEKQFCFFKLIPCTMFSSTKIFPHVINLSRFNFYVGISDTRLILAKRARNGNRVDLASINYGICLIYSTPLPLRFHWWMVELNLGRLQLCNLQSYALITWLDPRL
jgi:hypothetical protein